MLLGLCGAASSFKLIILHASISTSSMYMLLLLRLSFLHVNLYVQFTSIFNSYNIDVQLSIIKRIPTNGN